MTLWWRTHQRLGVDTLEFQEVFRACRRRGISVPPVPQGLEHAHMVDFLGLEPIGGRSPPGLFGRRKPTRDVDSASASQVPLSGGDDNVASVNGPGDADAVAVVKSPDTLAAEYGVQVREMLGVWLELAHTQKVPASLLLHLRLFVSQADEDAARDTTSNTRNALRALHTLRERAAAASGGTGTGDSIVEDLDDNRELGKEGGARDGERQVSAGDDATDPAKNKKLES